MKMIKPQEPVISLIVSKIHKLLSQVHPNQGTTSNPRKKIQLFILKILQEKFHFFSAKTSTFASDISEDNSQTKISYSMTLQRAVNRQTDHQIQCTL